MATLVNINPKQQDEEGKEKNVSGTSSSTITPTSEVSGPATSGVQQGTPASGRFTNLQKYMGANKQAGTQLGQAVGQNVAKDVTRATNTANQSQQAFQTGIQQGQNTLGQLNTYNQNLGQKQEAPTQQGGLLSKQTGPAYLASGYEANLGNRANYAQQLAGNQEELNKFINYRSGQQAAQTQQELQQQQSAAEQANQNAMQRFQEKQSQVSSPQSRGELLNDVAKSRTYGLGQQSLDKAFLQMDKNNTVGNLKSNLQQQQQQFAAQNLLPKLSEQVGTLKTGLNEGTQALQKQTQQNLSDLDADIASRQQAMTDARNERLAALQNQFQNLQSGGPISYDFAKTLGLKEGQTLYNTLADIPNINSYLDTKGLQAMPGSQADLANQRDVDLYSAFAKLAQTNPALTQASALTAEGKVLPAFAQRLAEGKQAAENYINQYANQYNTSNGDNAAEFWYDPRSLMNTIDQKNYGKGVTLDQLLADSGTNMAALLGGGVAGQHRDVKTPFGTFRLSGTSSAGGTDEQFIRGVYDDVLRDMANQGLLNQVRIAKGGK